MRVMARSLGMFVLALLGAIALAASWTMTTAVQLLATTAFIMGGMEHPLVNPNGVPEPVGRPQLPVGGARVRRRYVVAARDNYIAPSGTVRGDSDGPRRLQPRGGIHPCGVLSHLRLQDIGRFGGGGRAPISTHAWRGDDCVAHIYPDGPGTTSTMWSFGYSQSARDRFARQAGLDRTIPRATPMSRRIPPSVLLANPCAPTAAFWRGGSRA